MAGDAVGNVVCAAVTIDCVCVVGVCSAVPLESISVGHSVEDSPSWFGPAVEREVVSVGSVMCTYGTDVTAGYLTADGGAACNVSLRTCDGWATGCHLKCVPLNHMAPDEKCHPVVGDVLSAADADGSLAGVATREDSREGGLV